ncbi:MAG: hypothetical protein WCP26_16780 [Actinomycetes bacterium]
MSAVRGFLIFLYDFVVGDDWRMSVAVIVGLAVTWGLAAQGLNLWWLLPIFVAVGLGISLRRARAAARRLPPT